tara:strand:+ start:230 stop:517 length:288 start_codon:yes stop_codon:yes gene_type:complete
MNELAGILFFLLNVPRLTAIQHEETNVELHERLLELLERGCEDIVADSVVGEGNVGVSDQVVATCYRPPSRIFAFIARRGALNAITEHWKSSFED